jgi:hypothetical protein
MNELHISILLTLISRNTGMITLFIEIIQESYNLILKHYITQFQAVSSQLLYTVTLFAISSRDKTTMLT